MQCNVLWFFLSILINKDVNEFIMYVLLNVWVGWAAVANKRPCTDIQCYNI